MHKLALLSVKTIQLKEDRPNLDITASIYPESVIRYRLEADTSRSHNIVGHAKAKVQASTCEESKTADNKKSKFQFGGCISHRLHDEKN